MVFILFSVHKKGYLTEYTKGRNLIYNPNCLKAMTAEVKNRENSNSGRLTNPISWLALWRDIFYFVKI